MGGIDRVGVSPIAIGRFEPSTFYFITLTGILLLGNYSNHCENTGIFHTDDQMQKFMDHDQ
jgi:hypothetical protein